MSRINQVDWPEGLFPKSGELTNDEKKRMRQYWRTPKEFVEKVEKEFGVKFILDLCATTATTGICHHVITEEDDIFTTDIGEHWEKALADYDGDAKPAVWMNPPYRDPGVFLKRATDAARENRFDLYVLLKGDSSTGWFSTYVWDMATTGYFPTKRISHDAPDYRLPRASGAGNNFASIVAYYSGDHLNDLPEDYQAPIRKLKL